MTPYDARAATPRDAYLQQLVVGLRRRDVPAADIEDVVDEVSVHLDSSGQRPDDAFGTPDRLAGDLARARGYEAKAITVVRGVASGLVIVAGFVLALNGLISAVTGGPAEVTVGTLALFAVLGVGIPAMVGPLYRTLAGTDQARWRWMSLFALVWVVAFAVQLVFTEVVVELPSLVAVAAGLPLMVLGGWLAWRSRDPLRAPGDPERGTFGRP